MLADYAVRVEHSRGRRIPEPQHPYRNDFQRDRDRVIHSRAFRRLEAKTQVFTRRFSDHFRNRLTHTLEVAQIARTIAAATRPQRRPGRSPGPGPRRRPSALWARRRKGARRRHARARTCSSITICMRCASSRTFELRYAAFRGLNLTFEVREGIIKHSHDYSADQFPELAEYLLDQRPPLEAQLIDLADEIAYDTADLDDGYEAHLLTLPQIRGGVPVFDRFYREAEETYPDAMEKLKFNEAVKRILDRMVGDLIRNLQNQIKAAGIRTLEDVRACPRRLATFSSEVEEERRGTKEFLYQNLYFSAALDPEKNDAERVIRQLFEFWMAKPESLPQSYQEKAEQEPLAASNLRLHRRHDR